jgi:hypothetical protein
MACVLTDNFNSYNDGNLPGQGSWINYLNGNYFDVQGSVVFEGAKAVYATGVIDSVVTKAGTALADGRQTVYFRSTGRAGWATGVYQCFRITKGLWGSPNLDVRLNKDGTWQYYNGTSLITGPGTWAEDTWNSLEFEWRSSDKKARYRINQGTWTSWDSFTGSASFANFDYVGVNWWNTAGGTGGLYIDYFAENPISAAVGRSFGFIIG